MTMLTTCSLEDETLELFYEPHRPATTAALAPYAVGRGVHWNFEAPQLASFQEELARVVRAWSIRVTAAEQDRLAALYQEFAEEDRELADAGMADYVRLLADADRQ